MTSPVRGITRPARNADQNGAGQNRRGQHGGPGIELKRLLAKVGIVAKPKCKCMTRAAEMDRNGPDWCESNLDKIVGWLREEYKARHKVYAKRLAAHEADAAQPKPEPLSVWMRLPFSETAARQIVRLAIRRARA